MDITDRNSYTNPSKASIEPIFMKFARTYCFVNNCSTEYHLSVKMTFTEAIFVKLTPHSQQCVEISCRECHPRLSRYLEYDFN